MLVNEDDFQAMMMKDHIYPRYESFHSQIDRFAKVTHIRGSQTASEIDLVIVERGERAFAYEFKFLRGKDASYNYRRIYQGLGQALLYFWYGFDQSTLCIGVSQNLDMLEYEKIEAKIRQALPAIDCIRKSVPCFGYTAYFEEKNKLKAHRFVWAQGNWDVKTSEMKKDREAILAGNVKTRGTPFLTRYGL